MITDDTYKPTEYLMYMHAGSGNHGCEAIVRSLCVILDSPCTVLSNHIEEDERAGLDDICTCLPARRHEADLFHKSAFYAMRKLTGNASAQMNYAYSAARPYNRYTYALSIGGDNYCYDDALTDLAGANLLFTKNNIPTALVGCSIEPDILKRPDIIKDLSLYKCIIARENITYRALCEALPQEHTEHIHVLPDPAFLLNAVRCELPMGFKEGHTIGINISPMIFNYEDGKDRGIILRNYKRMIETIIEETSDMIALIPHVVTPASDDMASIQTLFDMYTDSGRLIAVEDMSAERLKYIISRCRLLITARTHASIAAYSTYVPTLVVGYSVKAKGIAEDIFGTYSGYVCPVKDLKTDGDLSDAYMELEARADEQRELLKIRIPKLVKEAGRFRELLSMPPL